jgi:hypothetical protein
MVEIPLYAPAAPAAPAVWNDLPAYESPVDGRVVDGRKQRRDDLARTHSRPYEGREQEEKEAAKIRAAREGQLDQLAEKIAHRSWAEAPERIRKVFRYK